MGFKERVEQAEAFRGGEKKKFLDPLQRDRELSEIKQRFKPREALMDVQEIWGKGRITEAQLDDEFPEPHFKLVSHIPSLVFSLLSQNTVSINTSGTISGISIHIAYPRLKGDYVARPFIKIENFGLQNRVDDEGYLSIESYIKSGVIKGLNLAKLERLDRESSNYYPDTIIDNLGSEDAVDRFNDGLVQLVQARIVNRTLPKDLEQAEATLIDQFPSSLRKKGFITLDELKAWRKELKGPSLLQKAGAIFQGSRH